MLDIWTTVTGALLAQKVWRAASHSTCAAYCKGSPTVQIYHLSTVWLGSKPHTDTHRHTNTKERTQLCTSDRYSIKEAAFHHLATPLIPQKVVLGHTNHLCYTHTHYKCIIINIIIAIIITSTNWVGWEFIIIVFRCYCCLAWMFSKKRKILFLKYAIQ